MGLFDRIRAAATDKAVALVEEGIALEDQHRPREALARYDAALRLSPKLARAHVCRGNILLEIGDVDGAAAAYSAAVSSDPAYAAAHYNLGNVHARRNERDGALAAYRAALARKPDFADAEVAMGALLEDMGRADEACASYRRAIAIDPGYFQVYGNLGHALLAVGSTDEALDSFRRAIEANPRFVLAYFWLAEALRDLGRPDEAIAMYRRLLEIEPAQAEAHNNIGNLLKESGRLEDAEAAYRAALAIDGRAAAVLGNLGSVLNGLGRHDEAIEALREALRIAPDSATLEYNLGNALESCGRVHDAIARYERAIELDASFADAHAHLGGALHRLGRLDDALAALRRALEIVPDHLYALNNLAIVETELGRFDEAIAGFRRVVELDPAHAVAHSNLLFVHNYLADEPPDALVREARRYGELVARGARPFTSWSVDADPERPLRVGFVSPDLFAHPVGHFTEAVVRALATEASSRVELFGYPTFFYADDVSERIRAACRGWSSAVGVSDERFARRIHDDRIDILLDLAGHTASNRLPVFAWKPAPVQATWLGYFATTGVAEIDYLIADPWTLPPSEEPNFIETIWRLPETRLCFTAPRDDVDVGPLPVIANGFVTFGCFNHLSKVNDAVVALWARVLAQVPDSRLLLKAKQLQQESVRANTLRRFAAHGIEAKRLMLDGPSPRREYLEAYRRVDIALDPFPYTGGTTSVEALWMGVPVLTLSGERFLSRQGIGLLMNTGLADWIAADADDYVARAVAHAGDRDALASLRATLRQRALASPIFDAPRFAVHFEAALRGMWRRWCARR